MCCLLQRCVQLTWTSWSWSATSVNSRLCMYTSCSSICPASMLTSLTTSCDADAVIFSFLPKMISRNTLRYVYVCMYRSSQAFTRLRFLCLRWWLATEGILFVGCPWMLLSLCDCILSVLSRDVVCEHDIFQTTSGNFTRCTAKLRIG